MEPNKLLNDLLINLKPKVIRFTGEKFPTELWNSYQIKKNKRDNYLKNRLKHLKRDFYAFFLNNFLKPPEVN